MARFHFTELERLRILESEDAPGTAEVIVNERRRKDQSAESYGLPRWHSVDERLPTAADGSREKGTVLWLTGEDEVGEGQWDGPPEVWRAWVSIPKLPASDTKVPFD